MDKDDHFRLFDTLACCSYDQLFDPTNFKEELALINSDEIDQEQSDSELKENSQMKDPNSKQSFLDKKNKNLSEFLEDQFYSQEILKESEEIKYEHIIQYLSKILGSEEKYFWRKVDLFSNLVSTYYSSIKSVNRLEFNFDPFQFKYALMQNFSFNSLPGMKPLSNWPISLEDLWEKLKLINLEELFNQPIEEHLKENFYNEAVQQLSNFDTLGDLPNLTRGICCFLCVLILFGDFLLLFKGIIFLKSSIKNKDKLDPSIFNNDQNPLILKLKDLLNYFKENNYNLYPIMRPYSIVDYFTINKSILYFYVKSSFNYSSSSCTDGTYIYFYLSGIDGCKLKVGTGYNNTEKGKVYLCIQNKDEIGIESKLNNCQWVYCNGKIYQKANKIDDYSNNFIDSKKEMGDVNVINPETLEVENKIKLLFPQNCLNDAIIQKNLNYILLSDGKKLSVLCLEIIRDNEKIKANESLNNDNLVHKYINLVLINFDVSNLDYTEEYKNKLSPQNKELIEEIYQSFSQIFTKEECFKALSKNNWDPKETALYLIDNPTEIKQSLCLGEQPIILFQSRIETQNIKSGGRSEFKCYNNTYFNVLNYQSYMWSLDENFVIAYILNEGACAIFGRDPKKYGKEFTYDINIKKESKNYSDLLNFKNKVFPNIKKGGLLNNEEGSELFKLVMFKKLQKDNSKDVYDDFGKSFFEIFENENIDKKEEMLYDIIKTEEEKDKDKIPNEKEKEKEKLVDVIYGTFVKKSAALSLNEKNYIITYDPLHKVYYLILSNFTKMSTFNILVSDTFQDMSQEYKLLLNFEDENLSKQTDSLESLLSLKSKEINLNELTDQILNCLYIVNSIMKYDIFWRYKNWSFFYNYLSNFIENRLQELDNSYNLNNFLYHIETNLQISMKTLSKRIDKNDEISKKILYEQLDEELNNKYKLKYIISSENKKKSKIYCEPNIRNIGSWESTSTLMFSYKFYKDKKVEKDTDEHIKEYVLSYENKKIYLTNKRIFFLSFKGDIDEINYLLELLTKKKENENNFNFITIEFLFKLIYIWISNIESALILSKKIQFQNAIKELNKVLKEYYKNSENESKIKKLIRLIILEGWNELNPSLEDQIFWFKDFYNFNKNTDEKEVQSMNDLNLEYYTIKNYEKYPFYCLMKKLDYSRNSLSMNNNFNKVNVIKAFHFFPIIYKNKYRLIALPTFHGFSSINMQLPFYWVLFNYNIDYFQRNLSPKIKPFEIEKFDGEEKVSNAYKGIVVNYKFQKINKIIYDKIELNKKIILNEDIINESYTKDKFEKINKEMLEFFGNNFNDNKLIRLMVKLIILCFGEMIHLYIKYNTPEEEKNYDDSLLSKNKKYQLNPNNNINIEMILEKFENIKNKSDENNNNIQKSKIKEEYKNTFISFYKYMHNDLEKIFCLNGNIIHENYELLKLNFSYLYFFFYGFKNKLLNNHQENISLLLAFLKKLDNYENNSLCLYNELGTVYSNAKVFEYYLNSTDIVNINHTISFDNFNDMYCVELELQIPNNEKVMNKDILIISNYHGYKNKTSYYSTNNIKSFGTSFMVKFNQSFKKTLFLKGSEIKIISPSDDIKSRHISADNDNNKNLGDMNLNRAILKIKVCPFNNHCVSVVKGKQKNIEGKINNLSLNVKSMEEIEYYLSYILKTVIKSMDKIQKENENILGKYEILKLGLKEDLYKKISNQFESDKDNNKCNENSIEKNKIDFLQNMLNSKENDSLISIKDNDDNIALSSKILGFIRKQIKEPIAYINIKKFQSFNPEIKKLWEKVEVFILYSFLYHLDLINDYKEVINNNEETFDNALELILGKKLNTIMSFLANKALLYKDGFDLIKNHLYDFEEEYNKLYEEIKQLILNKVYKVKNVDIIEKKEDKKEDEKETTTSENTNTETDKKEKKKSKLDKLKDKFGSKDANYKKKSNAHRTLYKEKKKKPKKVEKQKADIDEENIKKQNEEREKYNNLNAKTLEQLIKETSEPLDEEIKEKLKNLKEGIINKYKNLISEDVNSRYFGNKEHLKSICKLYKIEYNDNNPNESIEKYSAYIYKELLYLLQGYQTYNKIIINQDKLRKKNPFISLAEEMIYKISLLLNLNNYNENNENEEFNILLSEKVKSSSISNSYSLALHSNNSNSFQNVSMSLQNISPDENYILEPKNQYILKSLLYYIIKYDYTVNDAIVILYTQYLRSNNRILGIRNLSNYLNKDLNHLTNFNYGLLALSQGKYKNGLLNGIESDNKVMGNIKNELISLLDNNIKILMNFIKELEEDNKNSTQDKIIINISKGKIESDYFKSNEDYSIKKVILILSDIRLILKSIYSHKRLFEEDLAKKNLDKFIDYIFNTLMYKKKIKLSTETEKTKKLTRDLAKIILDEIILLNIPKITDYIFGHLYNSLCSAKDKTKKKSILELVRDVLLNYNKVNQNNTGNIHLNADSNIIKISSKLLESIEASISPELINLSSQIIIYIYKSISSKGRKELNNLIFKDTEILFKKIGKLFMFDENLKLFDNNKNGNNEENKTGNYYVLVQMNSTEFDYQFLVNALYYWEEKYPTELSAYKFEKELKDKDKKDQEKDKKDDIIYNPLIKVENKYNVKLNNYFISEKGDRGKLQFKMTKLVKKHQEKLDQLISSIEALNKELKNEKITKEQKDKNKETLDKLLKTKKYYYRILSHIKTAEEIGEIASIKGYAILLPKMPHKKALELCDLIYKAQNRLLKHFSIDIDENNKETLFNDEMIYPPLPTKNKLFAGLTTTLKETTKSNLNFTLITENEYNILSEAYDYFSKELKASEKREKFGKYNDNFMLGYTKDIINSINYNSFEKKIIDEDEILTGKCITIIIQSIIELLYNIYELNSTIITKLVRDKLKLIKTEFNFNNVTEENMKIIGMFLFINNFYNIIRQNTKVTNSNNKEGEPIIVGKVICGGDKSGSNSCKVCFTNKSNYTNKQTNNSNLKSNQNVPSNYNLTEDDIKNKIIFKIENVNLNSLNKYEENEDLLKYIQLNEIFDIFIISYEHFKSNPSFSNQILLNLSLKLLNNKKIETSEISRLYENDKSTLNKVILYLEEISNKANWLEKKDRFWESEFIDAFERLQNKFNIDFKNLIGIYSPIFHQINHEKSEIIQKEKKDNSNKKTSEDLIINYNMPKSDFISELPQLKDYSKITSSLRNIIIFERYFVGEIYNYCKQQYSEIDYMNSLSQIRYQLSIGNLDGLKNDVSAVFDNGNIPITGLVFRSQFDTNEIFVEEIYPNNYYYVRLNKVDTPVLVLLQDYTIASCLCLLFDDYRGKMYTQWINNEEFKLLQTPIKIPSFSFNSQQLIEEYNYIEKKLRILYSKNSLFDIMVSLNRIKFDIPLKNNNNLSELQLESWKKYKLNATSGVFNNLNNYILMKNSPKIQKLLSEINKNEQNNLNDLINKSLLGFENDEVNKNAINTNENKINKIKNDNIKKWVMEEWKNLDKNLKTITVNLYKDYIEKSNILFNTPEGQKIYHVGDFNYRLIALHELVKIQSDFDTSDICGLLITFEQKAFLEANAKLTFYSDPYGEDIIGEISSFKSSRNNLPTYIFNFPKVWVKYTPGSRCFYLYEWDTIPIGSDLPCLITAIPCNWPLLIQMTDYITDDIFKEETNNVQNNNIEYKKLIHSLINHCTSNQIPSEIQRRIFNITTRTLFKYKQYLKIHENDKEYSIEEKIDLISTDKGKDLVELIKKVEKTSENKGEKSDPNNHQYYSSYVVEGVEIILAILSIIKGPNIDIGIISNFLKNKFNYSLPVFIETIEKLNVLIDFINNSKENQLESNLIKELNKENDLNNFLYNNVLILKVNDEYENIVKKKVEEEKAEEIKEEKGEEEFEDEKEGTKMGKFKKERIINFIKNIRKSLEDDKKFIKKEKEKKDNKEDKDKKDNKPQKKDISKEIIKKPLKEYLIDILKEYEVIIVNSDNDILEFNFDNEGKKEKYIGVIFDGFILSNKNLKEPEIKKEEEKKVEEVEEEPFWLCYYCQMENDKNNSFCVFCDKDKKVLKKDKPKPKAPEEPKVLGTPDNYELVLKYYEKKITNLIKKLQSLDYSPFEAIYFGEDIINLPNYPGPLNNYLNERINKYKNNKDFLLPKLSSLKKLNNKNLDNLIKKLSDDKEVIKPEDAFELTMNCLSNGIDIWFENVNIKEYINSQKNKNFDLNLLAKISTVIDKEIISNQIYNKIENYALILPSNQIRNIYSEFNNFNQISKFNELNEYPLNMIRYYWSIIKYYNNCLKTSLPFIKPPSPYKTILKNSSKADYILVPLYETITTFLTNNRGLIFNSIKTGLLNSIIDSSEYSEEEIQITKMKFERLEIANNIDKKKNNVIKMMTNNINYTDDVNEQAIDNINVKNLLMNNLTEKDSLFLQAFNQYKNFDISSYRAKKMPGDPKLAFQVIFKNEFVQGLGGPYRQFFSDISKELNEYLPLLIETQNNINKKGEFKDLFTINPSYNGINALEQYEFLGVLMGICIRTGVHLTLDLCSLVWKQIVNEKINLEDILQYDEGLYNIIKTIYYYDPNSINKKKENNSNEISEDNNPINKEKEDIDEIFNYNTILSDGTLKYFNQNSKEKKELILSKSTVQERLKYISMLLYYRLNEAETQINSIKQGLSKIIPLSILQLFTGNELSMLVCGKKEVDIDLLRQNTKLSNDFKEDSKEVRWLWEILNEFSQEEKIKFIKFCWAQERLPTSNEEYVKNQIAFTIKYNKNDKNKNGFPRADTCFFNLELPNYTSKNIMKKNLLVAISLDNNSMNADKVTGVNSMNISSNNQRSSNRDENEDDYDDEYSGDDKFV